MKTLIVKYILRNEQSNTKRLLDAFKDEIDGSNVEELDLLDDVPEEMPLSKMDTKDETIVSDWRFIHRQTKLEVFVN